MVLYEYDASTKSKELDLTFFETISISIGGTCTVRLNNGEVYDLVDTYINYNIRTLSGKVYRDSLLEENPLHMEGHVFGLDEINEVIFEGFIITEANKKSILNLLHEDGINFIKIPRRD